MEARNASPFRAGIVRAWLVALSILIAAPAAAQGIDPNLVGTWQLQWPGPPMYWQVRADGNYRLFGVGARPNEHWGTMTAGQGHFASKSPLGEDGGPYSVSGDVWTTTGKVGTGSWSRVWGPGGNGSSGTCPLVDSTLVESILGTYFQVRQRGEGCEFRSTIAGSGDLTISITRPQGFAPKSFDTARRLGSGNKVDVPGVGDRAFVNGQTIKVLKGSVIIIIGRSLHPAPPDGDMADLIKLGQAVSQRF